MFDYMIPRRDGLSALAELRPLFPAIPMLIVTAYLDDVRDAAEVLGASCLEKTTFLDRILGTVAEYDANPAPAEAATIPEPSL